MSLRTRLLFVACAAVFLLKVGALHADDWYCQSICDSSATCDQQCIDEGSYVNTCGNYNGGIGNGMCSAVCGNNVCELGEDESTCYNDCSGEICGNGVCMPSLGEHDYNCSADCYCGNGICEPGEAYWCTGDCGNPSSCSGSCDPNSPSACDGQWMCDPTTCTCDSSHTPNVYECYSNWYCGPGYVCQMLNNGGSVCRATL